MLSLCCPFAADCWGTSSSKFRLLSSRVDGVEELTPLSTVNDMEGSTERPSQTSVLCLLRGQVWRRVGQMDIIIFGIILLKLHILGSFFCVEFWIYQCIRKVLFSSVPVTQGCGACHTSIVIFLGVMPGFVYQFNRKVFWQICYFTKRRKRKNCYAKLSI